MASNAECEKCFKAYVVISKYISGSLVHTTAITCLLQSFAEKKKTIQSRGFSKHRQILALCLLTNFAHLSSWRHCKFRHRDSQTL